MTYSLVGIIAILVHLIVNLDIFFRIRNKKPFMGQKYYLIFLLSVIAYHITDVLWGFLWEAKLYIPLFVDTVIYFLTMASSILAWGYFVYKFLGSKNKRMVFIGSGVFIIQILIIALNFEFPILFTISKECEYKAEVARYVILIIQMMMYLALAAVTFYESKKKDNELRRRYLIVAIFSIFMLIAILLQALFPLIPMYSYGYLFGICILHTLVVEDEKAYQRIELAEARYKASYDDLTGAMSKHAYVDAEAEIDKAINEDKIKEFAMVVFDLNNLKDVNDAKGHDAGDRYIINSVKLIAKCFNDVSVYRIGGDEFTIILKDENYKNRKQLLESFNHQIEENIRNSSEVVVSAGMADYIPNKDSTILQIFTRADREMYARKHYLKEIKK